MPMNRNLVIASSVVLFHVAALWALQTGLLRRAIEVGLIFAMVGKNLGVMSEAMFSVIVIMVILTTLLTPPILTVLLRRQET